jgi:hypothetical protein
VARPGTSLNSVDDVDHAGVKVAVAEHSPADGFLTRTLRKATIVRLPQSSMRSSKAPSCPSPSILNRGIHATTVLLAT